MPGSVPLPPSADRETQRASHQPRRDLFELFVAYGLIFAVLWTPDPWQRIFFLLAFVAIFAILILRRDDWPCLGLRLSGMMSSFWIVGVALICAFLAVWVAFQLHTLHPFSGATRHQRQLNMWGYAVWAFQQQLILQGIVLLRLRRLLHGNRRAVVVAALLFASAHLPSPLLTVLTLVWGWIACTLFLRYRNLYTLAAAHAVLGICIAVTVPNQVQHHMRVGLGYLHYRPPLTQQSAP